MEKQSSRLYGRMGLVNKDGKIPPEWLDLPRFETGIFVPRQNVSVGRDEAIGQGTCIIYPKDERWKELPLSHAALTNWLFGVLHAAQDRAWKAILEPPEGLLGELIGLKDGSDDDIAAFAQKWGPLWNCHEHDTEDCFLYYSGWFQPHLRQHCSWRPAESTSDFRKWATRLHAAYCSAERMREGNPVPAEWEIEYWIPYKGKLVCPDLAAQRFLLATKVNSWIASLGPPSLTLDWYPEDLRKIKAADDHPRMGIHPGLGFLPLACLHLIQCVCGIRQLCVCSCTHFFDLVGKRSRKGAPNLCPACRDKARKLKWYHGSKEHDLQCPTCGKSWVFTTRKTADQIAGTECPTCRKKRL